MSKLTDPYLDDLAQKRVYKREYLRLKYGGAMFANDGNDTNVDIHNIEPKRIGYPSDILREREAELGKVDAGVKDASSNTTANTSMSAAVTKGDDSLTNNTGKAAAGAAAASVADKVKVWDASNTKILLDFFEEDHKELFGFRCAESDVIKLESFTIVYRDPKGVVNKDRIMCYTEDYQDPEASTSTRILHIEEESTFYDGKSSYDDKKSNWMVRFFSSAKTDNYLRVKVKRIDDFEDEDWEVIVDLDEDNLYNSIHSESMVDHHFMYNRFPYLDEK